MTSAVAGIVQNFLFGGRNFVIGSDANQNNQIRLIVSAGQTANLLREGKTCGNSIFAKTSEKILNSCSNLAKNDTFLSKLGKVVDFASKNVNKLIVVASGYKVFTAEDKQTEFLAQAGNVAGMFAIEGWMKNNLSKYINKLPIPAKIKPIVEGLVFVIGSITGSTLAYKGAKTLALKIKESNEEYKAQQKQPKNILFAA